LEQARAQKDKKKEKQQFEAIKELETCTFKPVTNIKHRREAKVKKEEILSKDKEMELFNVVMCQSEDEVRKFKMERFLEKKRDDSV
jgi:hypothetical protein